MLHFVHLKCTFLQAVLHLQLKLGQCSLHPLVIQEYDNMQHSLQEFYSACPDDGTNQCTWDICPLLLVKIHRREATLNYCVSFIFLAGNMYGPFVRLDRDSQELSLCCLYYFSYLEPSLLKSITSCCLCKDFLYWIFTLQDRCSSYLVYVHC